MATGDMIGMAITVGVIAFIVFSIWSKVTGKPINKIIHDLTHTKEQDG